MPHDHGYGIDENFPMDGSVLAAENYCRDPGGDGYLWCYTLDENIRWEYCFVPQCIGKLSLKYVGIFGVSDKASFKQDS